VGNYGKDYFSFQPIKGCEFLKGGSPVSQQNSKADQIVWWIVGVLLSIILIGGSAWANSINAKVEEIATLRVNIQYIQADIKDIKEIIKLAVRGKYRPQDNHD